MDYKITGEECEAIGHIGGTLLRARGTQPELDRFGGRLLEITEQVRKRFAQEATPAEAGKAMGLTGAEVEELLRRDPKRTRGTQAELAQVSGYMQAAVEIDGVSLQIGDFPPVPDMGRWSYPASKELPAYRAAAFDACVRIAMRITACTVTISPAPTDLQDADTKEPVKPGSIAYGYALETAAGTFIGRPIIIEPVERVDMPKIAQSLQPEQPIVTNFRDMNSDIGYQPPPPADGKFHYDPALGQMLEDAWSVVEGEAAAMGIDPAKPGKAVR